MPSSKSSEAAPLFCSFTNFCTSRYLISKELGLLKLNAVWGIRANRFEEKIRIG